MIWYTKIEYSSPLELSPAQPDDDSQVAVTRLTLWGCDSCGALVWDQVAHSKMHDHD